MCDTGKRQKVAAGDGKKPSVTKEDPVFNAVYKSAAGELKRQVYFVNAFPTSAESDNLPQEVYNYGVHSVKESKAYNRDDLQKLTKAYNGQWFSCVRPLADNATRLMSLTFSIVQPSNQLALHPVEENDAQEGS